MKEIRSELVKINSEVLEIDISIKIHELYNEIKSNIKNLSNGGLTLSSFKEDLSCDSILEKIKTDDILVRFNSIKHFLNLCLFILDKIKDFYLLNNSSDFLLSKTDDSLNKKSDLLMKNQLSIQLKDIESEEKELCETLITIFTFYLPHYLNIYKAVNKEKKDKIKDDGKSKNTKNTTDTTSTNTKTQIESKIKVKLHQIETVLIIIIKNLSILKKQNCLFKVINENQTLNSIIKDFFSDQLQNISLSHKLNLLSKEFKVWFGGMEAFVAKYCFDFDFVLNCFSLKLSEQFSTIQEKALVICSDSSLFYDSYISIIDLFSKHLLEKNNECVNIIRSKLIQMSSNFAFFTYNQFLQNEIYKVMIEDYANEKTQTYLNYNVRKLPYKNFLNTDILKNDVYKQDLAKIFMNFTNFILNLTKQLKEVLEKKKLFVKIIPHFMNFMASINNYVINKFASFFSHCTIKIFVAHLAEDLNFSFESNNMTGFLDLIVIFFNKFDNYFSIFTNFSKEIIEVINRENVIFSYDVDLRVKFLIKD